MGRRFWCNGEHPLVPFLVLLSVLLPLSYPSQFTLTLAHALPIKRYLLIPLFPLILSPLPSPCPYSYLSFTHTLTLALSLTLTLILMCTLALILSCFVLSVTP